MGDVIDLLRSHEPKGGAKTKGQGKEKAIRHQPSAEAPIPPGMEGLGADG